MTADTTELLPCPFCGGPASFEHTEAGRWTVGCSEEDGRGFCMGFQSLTTFARKSDAIAAWNRRATLSDPHDTTKSLGQRLCEAFQDATHNPWVDLTWDDFDKADRAIYERAALTFAATLSDPILAARVEEAEAALKAAFLAGWWKNAATPGEDGAADQRYFDACAEADWQEHRPTLTRLVQPNPAAQAARQELEQEVTRLNARNVEASMLAYKWMVAHDHLRVGLPYDLPRVADVPASEAARQSAEARVEELEKALTAIRDLEPEPFEFPADWEAQIEACPDCKAYANHPIQRGICDAHRRPLWRREEHADSEERRIGWRAKSIAREALQPKPADQVSVEGENS